MPPSFRRPNVSIAMNAHPFQVAGLPDETLDSVLARTFKLYAFGSWRYVYKELCGHPGRLPLNGLPGRLDDLAAFLGYPWTGMGLLQDLTLWKGFSAFMLGDERTQLAKKLVVHREIRASPKGQAKPRTRQPFRFCERCLREDYDAYGISYWHRSHQMPLVNVCWKHGTMLQELVTSRGLQVIPMPGNLESVAALCHGQCTELSKRFAQLAHDILACDTSPTSACHVGVVWKRMELRGLTFGTRIHYEAAALQCKELQDRLDNLPHLESPSRWLSQVLYASTSNLPMNLIVVASLFDSWHDFLDACSRPGRRATPPVKPCVGLRKPISRQVLQEAFKHANANVPEVARALEFAGNTVRTCARYYGISVPKHKGFISPRVRQAISSELRRGISQYRISTRYGVSLSSVDIIRRSSEDIDRCRRALLEKRNRATHRRKLERYRMNGLVSWRSDVRKIDSCLYQWLLKHDREWFEQIFPEARVFKTSCTHGDAPRQ